MAHAPDEPGTVSWVELGTHHLPDAADFYASLFGWAVEELPPGQQDLYTIFNIGGGSAAGMYEQSTEEREQARAPLWVTYFAVADIDDAVQRVQSLGGRVEVWPTEMPELGKWALVSDPSGAVFALWQSYGHGTRAPEGQAGTFAWAELETDQPDKARMFYTQLFGWEAQTGDTSEGIPYTSFWENGRMVAGMMPIQQSWGNVQPGWLVYFHTHDADAGVSAATDMGGKVLQEPRDIPGVGRFSILRDPQGALFAIIRRAGAA